MEFENLRLVRSNPFLACSQGGDTMFWLILNCCCCEGKVPMPDAPEIPKLKVRKKSEILT